MIAGKVVDFSLAALDVDFIAAKEPDDTVGFRLNCSHVVFACINIPSSHTFEGKRGQVINSIIKSRK